MWLSLTHTVTADSPYPPVFSLCWRWAGKNVTTWFGSWKTRSMQPPSSERTATIRSAVLTLHHIVVDRQTDGQTSWDSIVHAIHSITQQTVDKTVNSTSGSYSRKTLKLTSLRRTGWAAMRCRNTSCMATVFLNVAKYSLKQATQTACFHYIAQVTFVTTAQLLHLTPKQKN